MVILIKHLPQASVETHAHLRAFCLLGVILWQIRDLRQLKSSWKFSVLVVSQSILQYLEIIEVQMKSVYAYEFTKIHGPTRYLDIAFFTNNTKHQEILDKVDQQKKKRLPHVAYLKHFVNDLHQDIPLWAYVDLFTISDTININSHRTTFVQSNNILPVVFYGTNLPCPE